MKYESSYNEKMGGKEMGKMDGRRSPVTRETSSASRKDMRLISERHRRHIVGGPKKTEQTKSINSCCRVLYVDGHSVGSVMVGVKPGGNRCHGHVKGIIDGRQCSKWRGDGPSPDHDRMSRLQDV